MKFLLFLLLTISNVMAGELCSINHDAMPVQSGGRVKPLFVVANENIKYMTGKTSYNDMDARVLFCKLSLHYLEPSDIDLPIKVEHVDTKKALGLDLGKNTMKASLLEEKIPVLNGLYQQQKRASSFKKDLERVIMRMQTYDIIRKGNAWTFPKIVEGKVEWPKLSTLATDSETLGSLIPKLKTIHADYVALKGDTHVLEMKYFKAHLFGYALALLLLAIFLFVIFKKEKFGLISVGLAIAVQLSAITFRVFISGRAPITNMYETVMFSGLGALLIAMIIYYFKREKVYVLAGAAYNILCLMMMMFAGSMISAAITPLVPVLRDNFWLSTHVTCIILSYAALALSWILSNMALFNLRFGAGSELKYYQSIIYTAIKCGIVLLAAGIILGGIWADYSWGRFWGWDPKETWSLIVLLFYMAILHGKSTTWVTDRRFVILTSAGFMTVMMAWFGVNYILASGLHSYGFSEGGAIFLFSFFAAQIAYILITTVNLKMFSKK